MRERVRQLGGTLEIRSDDAGTAVTATLPLAEPTSANVEKSEVA
jgi:signal transduction histidine kinase